MAVQGMIPFAVTGYITDLQGLSLGQEFRDPRTGYNYRLYQVSSTCQGDKLTAGEALGFSAENVVTNLLAGYLETSTGFPIAAGVCPVTCPESTSSTTYYILVLVDGYYATVKTDGGGDIAQGEDAILDTTVFGAVDRQAAAATALVTGAERSLVGRATADDTASTVALKVTIAR